MRHCSSSSAVRQLNNIYLSCLTDGHHGFIWYLINHFELNVIIMSNYLKAQYVFLLQWPKTTRAVSCILLTYVLSVSPRFWGMFKSAALTGETEHVLWSGGLWHNKSVVIGCFSVFSRFASTAFGLTPLHATTTMSVGYFTRLQRDFCRSIVR